MALPLTPEQEAWAVLLNDPTSNLGKAFAAVLSRNYFLGTLNEQLNDSTSTLAIAVKTSAGAPLDATALFKGAVALAGDLGGSAASPTVKSAAGATFKQVSGEPTISNDSTVGGNADGGPIRIGNHKGYLRVVPFTDGTTYIQSTQNGLRFSGINATQGAGLVFDYSATNFTGSVTVAGAVSVPAPTAASNPTTKTYVDAADTTLSGRINTLETANTAATNAPTASTLMKRDANGRAQVAAPSAGGDILNLTAANGLYVPLASKSAVSGVAELDSGQRVLMPAGYEIAALASAPANPASGKSRWYTLTSDTVQQLRVVDNGGLVRRATHDWGSGTSLPAVGSAMRGDSYTLTNVGAGCVFIHNGSAWKQAEIPVVASLTAMNSIAVVYRGFQVYRSDLGYNMEYQTTNTGWTKPWSTPWGIVSGTVSYPVSRTLPQNTAQANVSVPFTYYRNRRYRIDTNLLLTTSAGTARRATYLYFQMADDPPNTAYWSTATVSRGYLWGAQAQDWVQLVFVSTMENGRTDISVPTLHNMRCILSATDTGQILTDDARLFVNDDGPAGSPL